MRVVMEMEEVLVETAWTEYNRTELIESLDPGTESFDGIAFKSAGMDRLEDESARLSGQL